MRACSRGFGALLAAALITGLVGGCIRPYRVVQQTTPNPFLSGASFKVAPLVFAGMQVGAKTEAGYLAGKDQQSQSSWEGDKQAMADIFMQELAAGVGGLVNPNGRYVIEPRVNFIEPGFYVGVAAGDAEVQMSVQIKDDKGAVLDIFELGVRVHANLSNASVGQRLRAAAGRLGNIVVTYLTDRTQPQ
jgi:hypothetical protein